jgi:hypothetical protein
MSPPQLMAMAITAVAIVIVLVVFGRQPVGDWLRTRRMVDPVEGTLLVTASSTPSGRSVYTNYRLHGVVSGPGLPATPVEHTGVARHTTWPYPGMTLPVPVDRQAPTRLRIWWNRLPTTQPGRCSPRSSAGSGSAWWGPGCRSAPTPPARPGW